MDDYLIESFILKGLSFLGISIVSTLLIMLCVQLQKRFYTFSKIGKSWNDSHRAYKVFMIGISLFATFSFIMPSEKWPTESFGSLKGQNINDFEQFKLPNLNMSKTCAKEEKDLAMEIFKYKTGTSLLSDVNDSRRKLHQALKSQGYHDYYVDQLVELMVSSYFKKINPFTKIPKPYFLRQKETH